MEVREYRLAIDAQPLTDNIFKSYDYTGVQLFSLGVVPIMRRISRIFSSPDNADFTIDLAPSSSLKSIASGYVRGLKSLVTANSFLARVAFRKLQSVRTVGPNRLKIEAKVRFPELPQLLALPNWINAEEESARKIIRINEKAWTFESETEKSLIRVVNSPKENSDLFLSGKIDFAADTAFDFQLIDQSRPVHIDTGLFAELRFNKKLLGNEKLIENLILDLDQISFSPLIEGAWKRIRRSSMMQINRTNLSKANRYISLSFNQFYPNAIICREIKNSLENFGWYVHLFEENYYAPDSSADIRFEISRCLARAPIWEAYFLFSYPGSIERVKDIAELVSDVERGRKIDLYETIRVLRLGYPLFHVPAYTMAVKGENPLLKPFFHFDWRGFVQ